MPCCIHGSNLWCPKRWLCKVMWCPCHSYFYYSKVRILVEEFTCAWHVIWKYLWWLLKNMQHLSTLNFICHILAEFCIKSLTYIEIVLAIKLYSRSKYTWGWVLTVYVPSMTLRCDLLWKKDVIHWILFPSYSVIV